MTRSQHVDFPPIDRPVRKESPSL